VSLVYVDVRPRLLIPDSHPEVGEEIGELPIVHRTGKAGNDGTPLLVLRRQAPQDHVEHVARIRSARAGAARKIDAAVRWRAAAVVATRTGRSIDRGAGHARVRIARALTFARCRL